MEKQSTGSMTAVFAIVLVVALAITGVGIWLAVQQQVWSLLAAGAVSVVATLVAWALSLQMAASHTATFGETHKALTNMNERFEQFSVMLNLISEQQLLSDRAKAVAFREKDSEALRRAIQEDIARQNWEGALSLCKEMEAQFGYHQEADNFRTQVAGKQDDIIRKQVGDSVAVIDRYTRAEAWPEAFREAQRIAGLFPNDTHAAKLPAEVEGRRQTQKKLLVQSWNDAVARHDVDGSIEILKRLDTYLTPGEAEGFQETARSVFKEKINILRTQFSVAVQDRNWSEALRLGESISRDFPNSQMAKEVREMLPSLRARAQGLEPEAAPV